MTAPDQQAWIHVDLGAIRSNVSCVSEFVGPGVEVMAVIKADAYGHGIIKTAQAAIEGGASCLGVATVYEGLSLREAGIEDPIVILGLTLPEATSAIVDADLSATVSAAESVEALQAAAAAQNTVAKLHLKVDTGMGRIGVAPDGVERLLDLISSGSHLEVEGLSTHIGWDVDQLSELQKQVDRIQRTFDQLLSSHPRPRWVHAANSLVTLSQPAVRYNLVRAGLLTYGIPPCDHPALRAAPLDALTAALSIHARITQVRELEAGQAVSYGGHTVVDRPTRAAIVPVGYGDGYPRFPSPSGSALANGVRCPILGVICMDQMVIDISDADVDIGDEVILLGTDRATSITAADLALLAQRIPYEIVTGLGARLPYRYTP